MQHQRFFLLVLPVLFASLGLLLVPTQLVVPLQTYSMIYSQEAQAQTAINAAQTAINTAYTSLAYADIAGAEISDLIGTLNNAINQLNQARRAYNNSNYATAITLAETSQDTAISVNEQAQLRQSMALIQLQIQVILIISVICIVVVIAYFGITRWQKYRKEKQREFLQMEIRLPDEEEKGEAS